MAPQSVPGLLYSMRPRPFTLLFTMDHESAHQILSRPVLRSAITPSSVHPGDRHQPQCLTTGPGTGTRRVPNENHYSP